MTVAAYSQGTLLLGDTIADGNSRVLLVSRDLTIAPVGTSTGSAPGLRECVSEISPATAGQHNVILSALALSVSGLSNCLSVHLLVGWSVARSVV